MTQPKQVRAATQAKLTEEQARIIKRSKGLVPAAEFCRAYQISVETVRRIWRGETWGWLDVEQPPIQGDPLPPGTLTEEELKAKGDALMEALRNQGLIKE